MARVNAPLMSLDASGTIGKALVYSKWKGRHYVRTWVIPSNPRTGLQVGMRSGIAIAPTLWNLALSASDRAAWGAAVGAEAISGFNLFCRAGQKSIRNNYGYFIQESDQSQTTTPPAPAGPSADQDGTDVDITWTQSAGAHTVMIFHGIETGFTASIASLIAIAQDNPEIWTHRNPGLGTHYYDIRSVGLDGGVGALAGEFDETVV